MRTLFLLVAVICACARADAPSTGAGPTEGREARATATADGADAGARKGSRGITYPDTVAAAFWRGFRAAALTGDVERIMQMTHFPFTVAGELEDDPETRVARGGFPTVFEDVLRQYEYPDLRDSLTMRELIRNTPRLESKHFNGENQHFHVGALYFGREDGRWQLLEAYRAAR